MTFPEAVNYLDSFVNYEKRSAYPYRRSFRLERIRMFLSRIGNPQDSFPSIHVAGTKGKGSVCVFCSHILRESGVRVGLYTSPHLNTIRERIRILEPGVRQRTVAPDFEGMIGSAELCSLVVKFKPAIDSFCASSPLGALSFFEVCTVLAFAYFKERGVGCAVLETGLGGRLDATNVVTPVTCAISSISLDHTDKLGTTLAQIAREKAGIIKSSGSRIVISAPQRARVRQVIEKKCSRTGCRLYIVGRDIRVRRIRRAGMFQHFDVTGEMGEYAGLTIRLLGSHQAINAACAVALGVCAGKVLKRAISAENIRTGLAKAAWPGRFEILRGRFVLDGAHNGESAKMLARTLRETFPGETITVILGVSRDKDLRAICRQLLGVSRRFIATAADHSRACGVDRIVQCLKTQDPGAAVVRSTDIVDAVKRAERARAGGICCITGSLFLVAQARSLIKGKRHA
jgi:dihydrofolate synthase / folylpolyglutamate synthase